MKKYWIICLILCFLLPHRVSAEAIMESAEETQSLTEQTAINSSQNIDAQTAMLGVGELVKNVRSAFLYEANSETLMYAYQADEKMYPASFVKIMTALIAAESGKLDDIVTVSASAVASVPFDAVSSDLVEGEQLSLNDLVYCMLVGSGNDAAAVIAEHISGSQEAFVETMNRRAQQIGCTGTNFTNAHGLHDENQYTTARDSARILKEALNNEYFYTIFTAYKYLVPATNKSATRALVTSNNMMDSASALYYDARVIGGRTGVSNDGRRCFIAVSESNGMRLISVVMGAESVFQEDGYSVITIGGFKETVTLMDAGFKGYKTAQVLFAGQVLKQCQVTQGTSDVYLGSKISVSTVLPDGIEASGLTFRFGSDVFRAPITAGERLTELEIWYGSMCVAKTDLYAMNSVSHIDSLNPVAEETDTEHWKSVAVIAISIFGGIVFLYIAWRVWLKVKIYIASRRSKRYRRNRRRSK